MGIPTNVSITLADWQVQRQVGSHLCTITMCTNAWEPDPRDLVKITRHYLVTGRLHNGTKAQCLLDSGCEGIMISPDFTRATGIVTKKLENPVVLQLACVSSKLTISYGAMSTIAFRNRCIEVFSM